MSTFEDTRDRWRETYIVLFDATKRPTLKNVTKTLKALNKRFELTNLTENDEGLFESLTLVSRDDFAALDICFTDDAEVSEQVDSLITDMKKSDADEPPPLPWSKIKTFNGRLDVLHFEQIPDATEEDLEDDMLDPGALLIVLGALAKLTRGVAIDPQAGSFLTDE